MTSKELGSQNISINKIILIARKSFFADKKFIRSVQLAVLCPKSPLSFYGRKFKGYERSERTYFKMYLNPKSNVLEMGGSADIVSCRTNKIWDNPNAYIAEPVPTEFLLL